MSVTARYYDPVVRGANLIRAADVIANELEELRVEAVAGRSRALRRLFGLRRQLYRIVKAMRPYRLMFHAMLRLISGRSGKAG